MLVSFLGKVLAKNIMMVARSCTSGFLTMKTRTLQTSEEKVMSGGLKRPSEARYYSVDRQQNPQIGDDMTVFPPTIKQVFHQHK
jgi:hypothetical protein